eukprot:2904768-Rhodomonas_salina.1
MFGRSPSVSFLHPFGCYSVAHLGKDRVKDGKLSGRGTSGIFLGVGFDEGYKGFRILDPETRRVFFSTAARTTFDEQHFPFHLLHRRAAAGPARWPMLTIPEDELE